MPKESKPIPDVAHYCTGAIQSRGFTLDGEMHGDWEFLPQGRQPDAKRRVRPRTSGRDLAHVRSNEQAREGDILLETFVTSGEQAMPDLSSGFGGSSLPGQELLRHTEIEMEEREAPKTYVQPDVPERSRRTTLRWFLWTGAILAAIVVASFLLR
jgi:hypothetical protein